MLSREERETLRLRYPRGGVAPTSDGLWSDLLDSLDEMDAALKAKRLKYDVLFSESVAIAGRYGDAIAAERALADELAAELRMLDLWIDGRWSSKSESIAEALARHAKARKEGKP